MPITDALAPYISGPGLSLGIKTGIVVNNGASSTVPAQNLILPANATSFIFYDITGAVIGQNTSGFPANCIPLATATTAANYISAYSDVRPDFIAGGGGTAGVISAPNVSITATTGNIGMGAPAAGANIDLEANARFTIGGEFITITTGDSGLFFDSSVTPNTIIFDSDIATNLKLGDTSSTTVQVAAASGQIGFYGAAPAVKPTITGSKGANAALTSLLSALATLGLITDSTT